MPPGSRARGLAKLTSHLRFHRNELHQTRLGAQQHSPVVPGFGTILDSFLSMLGVFSEYCICQIDQKDGTVQGDCSSKWSQMRKENPNALATKAQVGAPTSARSPTINPVSRAVVKDKLVLVIGYCSVAGTDVLSQLQLIECPFHRAPLQARVVHEARGPCDQPSSTVFCAHQLLLTQWILLSFGPAAVRVATFRQGGMAVETSEDNIMEIRNRSTAMQMTPDHWLVPNKWG